MLPLLGIVIPFVLSGTDVDVVVFIFPLIIETTDGCLIIVEGKEVKRHVAVVGVDEVTEDDDDDDDDDEPATDALII